MLKAILFDIDGVLIDSATANADYYDRVFIAAGYKPPTQEDYKRMFHLTMREVIARHLHINNPEKIEAIMHVGSTIPYNEKLVLIPPDAQTTVAVLAKSFILGLVSGRIRRGIIHFYNIFGGREYFSVEVAAEDYVLPKPNPEPLQVALIKLKLKPAEAVYIGDQPTDIEAAHKAGMKAIGFGPFHPQAADAYADNFKQLPDLLTTLSLNI